MSRADQLLSYRQVAERWGCSTKTVQRFVRNGIPGTRPREPFPVVRIGRLVRFHTSDLEYVENKLHLATILPMRRGRRAKAAA